VNSNLQRVIDEIERVQRDRERNEDRERLAGKARAFLDTLSWRQAITLADILKEDGGGEALLGHLKGPITGE
jgi:hypothetical protein